MSRNRAMALLEMLLYASLLLFVLAIIYSSLVMGVRAYRRTENMADLQQKALVALRTIVEESASSPAAAVRVEPAALVFLSARDPAGRISYAADGRALWRQWVLIYRNSGSATVLRKVLPITPTAEPPGTVPAVATIRDNPGLGNLRIAERIADLHFTPGSGVQVDVVAADEGGEPSVQLTGRVAFRQ